MKRHFHDGYQMKIDEASATVTYIGYAGHGVATSSALWYIEKVSVSGTVTSIQKAKGGQFVNVWDDRATLTYS